MAKQKQLIAIVKGYVQGVSFRYYTRRVANQFGLTGWVANQWDGTVKVVAEGDAANLEALLAFLHEGSPAAQVEQVDVKWGEATGLYSQFSIQWTNV